MERLHQSLDLQQKVLTYIVTKHLTPLRQQMADYSKPTLAHMAKEQRLTRLVEILQGSLEAEHHLSVWFQGLKSPLEPDIETVLERTLQTIEQANDDIKKQWNVPQDETNENTSKTERPLSDKGTQNRTNFTRIPSQRRKGYSLDSSIFRQDETAEEKRHDILETKIASLHRSLYEIVLTLKQLIEAICNKMTGSPDSLKLGITPSDMYLIMMKFPQAYVLSEDDNRRRNVGQLKIGRCGSIEIRHY